VSRAGRQVDKIILDEINNFSERMLEAQVAIARGANKWITSQQITHIGALAEGYIPPSYEDLESLVGHMLMCCDECGVIFEVLEVNITGTALKLLAVGRCDDWYPVGAIMKMSVVVRDKGGI